MPNQLSAETSPYLLQHANNPVHWYAWGSEPFERAVAENKPVLVSIGYAACHWCHVMERESFENEETAAFMNEHFINIKVDREERPDVDAVYMDAVQAIAGSGGWPLNVFLTPDKKPFYGGTYYPPRRAFNRLSWVELLQAIVKSFTEKRHEIDAQAENLMAHIAASNNVGATGGNPSISRSGIHAAFKAVMKSADKEWGGFGRAPKFPQTFTINFLLAYAHLEKNEEALAQALLSMDKMMQGGLYDHIGGGFARYSTDTEWLAPHFEKMLYDNALLVVTLCDAYRLTGKEKYRAVIDETLAFTERELMHANGGFYSALDADSEGEEGKFYVWSFGEVQVLLGADADLFCRFYDITPEGNWEGKAIPRVLQPAEMFAAENGLDEAGLLAMLSAGRQKLLEARNSRIRPQLDDKILLSWNALMNLAFTQAYAATGNSHYLDIATANLNFLLTAFGPNLALLHHTWQKGTAKHPSFLDDYSYLIAALTTYAQVSSSFQYLHTAGELVNIVQHKYADSASPLFFYTESGQPDIPVQKKEVYDGATPSGNAVMALNLHMLGILLDKPVWREQSEAMLMAMAGVAVKYPTSFGVWLSGLYQTISGTHEVAIVGPEWEAMKANLLKHFIPHQLLMAAVNEMDFALLRGKESDGKTRIFLCRNYECSTPVNTLSAALSALTAK